MNRSWLALAGLVLLSCPACGGEAVPPAGQQRSVELKTTRDQAGYAIGLNIGRSLQADGIEVNIDALVQGIRDIFGKTQPRLTDEQCRAALSVLQREASGKQAERQRVEGDKNRREGDAFLLANKTKEGVVALPSGLQYKVLKSGQGPSPKLTDKVRAHYHGTFVDGTVFDSSVQRGEPAVFAVGGVIRGWTEALQKMKVGDKWTLFVPSELAYGPQGMAPAIGPHAVLIFDVELLGIE
jgi:FKBP-type peptidyl-prolyl cis-trans isomerase FklB